MLEGVAYGLRDSLELLRELGVDARVGRVSGGGARSELWLTIVASVLGLPLELTAVEEGAATAQRCSPASGPASGAIQPKQSALASAFARPSSPIPRGSGSTTTATAASGALYPALRGAAAGSAQPAPTP